jgi:hypothetical protein
MTPCFFQFDTRKTRMKTFKLNAELDSKNDRCLNHRSNDSDA